MIDLEDLAQVIFSNFTSAAGTLAETKFALRQVENEEEKQRLQERVHQETMWFNKASMLAKMYADEKVQERHEETTWATGTVADVAGGGDYAGTFA